MVDESSFYQLWQDLLRRIVISKPKTDLYWTCQRNYTDISVSSNLPEPVKKAKLRKQQQHLAVAQAERATYQRLVASSEQSLVNSNTVLSPHRFCSSVTPCHYSFDYAQQVHLPHDPMQPGPMYFLCPRKVEIFGVCCEGIPQ